MAGKGFPPKPEDRKARGKKSGEMPFQLVEIQPVAQPELPMFDITVKEDGELRTQEFVWPERTREWWRMWGESPLSANYTENDWSELLDTAMIHARFWNGDMKLAGELRLRAAKFGATPEDRARLRIQFATADEVEARNKKDTNDNPSSSRNRYKPPAAG